MKGSNELSHVCLLVALSLSLNFYGINWGLPNGAGDWANDSVAPLGPLVYAQRILQNEAWWSKYPPFHYMVLTALYTPYAIYLYLTGGVVSPTDSYPYGFTDPELSLMIFTLIARLTSAIMGTGTVLVTYFTVKNLYGRRAGLISGFLIATSYAVVYYAHNANVDVPQLFWISLALHSFVCLIKTFETRHYVLLGLFSAFAVGTKDSAYALFPGVALSVLWFHMRHDLKTNSATRWPLALFDRKLLLGFGTFAVALLLVFNLPFNWQGFLEHVQFHLGRSVRDSRVIRESATIVQGDLTLIGKYLYHFIEANGLPTFLLLAAGFFYCLARFPEKSWAALIPIIAYYALFLRATATHHLRYALPVYLLLTWHAGKLGSDLLGYGKIPRLVSAFVLVLILGHSLLYGSSLNLLLARDSRYTAEKWIEKNIPKEAVIAALHPGYSLPRFSPGRKVRYIDTNRKEFIENAGSEADYLVVDMSLPVRINRQGRIHQTLHKSGFCPAVSFKSEVPLLAREVFHAVNPNIVIFQRSRHSTNCTELPGTSAVGDPTESRLLEQPKG